MTTPADGVGPFAELLQQYRRAAGLSQEDLAERAGLSARGISDLERGVRRAPYPTTVRLLAQALGLPEAERAALLAAGRQGTTTAGEPAREKSTLPVQLSSFVGREHEIGEVGRLLESFRLLTLTGPGGVGKTRLAIVAATARLARFADGIWFVDLAPISEPAHVSQAVASALSVREQRGRPVLATLAEALRAKELLLVLDNCEHIVGAVAALADSLLRVCPELRVLATSREPLHVAEETIWPVQPLGVPERDAELSLEQLGELGSVHLFVERSQATLPDFHLTETNASGVAEICRSLEGIPLALELAAARVRVLGVPELARRLNDRLNLLAGGSRSAPLRQQTLRATLDWSYELLNESERRLLARLAVFAGGWTLEIAEAVCAADGLNAADVLDELARLVDRSLVLVEPQPDGAMRYRLLETVRQYAHERLAECGGVLTTGRHHAEFFAALAEAAGPELRGPAQNAWLARLDAEHDNLREALRWCLAHDTNDLALRLASALWWFWWLRGYWREGYAWLAAALEADAGGSTPMRAQALNGAGSLAMARGEYVVAADLLAESLAVGEDLGDRLGIARVLHNLAHLAREQGSYQRATALYEQSHALFTALEDTPGIALTAGALGDAAMINGEFEAAEARYAVSLEAWQAARSPADIGVALCDLGWVALQRGDHARADRLLRESLRFLQEAGDRRGAALALKHLGAVACDQGDYEQARAFLDASVTQFQTLGDQRNLADALEELALLAVRQGQAERAARLYGAVRGLREATAVPEPPTRRSVHDGGVAAVRSALPGGVFAALWTVGRVRPVEQASAETLPEGERPPISSSAAVDSRPDLLTPREREVAELLTQGLTNQEIANALVITERTVENHVAHIFDKLGVRSRTQVATWALTRGLPVAGGASHLPALVREPRP